MESKFWFNESKEGGEVTDKNDAAIRTNIPNTDSIFKDLLIFFKNTMIMDCRVGILVIFCIASNIDVISRNYFCVIVNLDLIITTDKYHWKSQ